MRMEELELVCQQAARTLAEQPQRPVPATVVLPLPAATRVLSLAEWPDDDPGRFDLLDRFASEVMRPAQAPCFGFVAEALVDSDDGPLDVLLVAYGARRHGARVTAAPLRDDGLGEFSAAEELLGTALPFLSPLQHAADAAAAPEAFDLG
ncbi:MAG: hypothetical protein H0W51_01765 [Euzebyales bacterium]|nr:hypothetical protein [Euzebyales bacterium]MDQ3342342.1 hypothetical protein [Actinomycetota bacterium]